MDAERTPEGFIRGTASITRTGVFPYRQDDGTVIWELRHPDDVFRADSLATAKMMPIQIEHNAMLDAKNMTTYKRGHVGQDVHVDAPFVRATVVLDTQEAVAAFDGGKREFSCGYYCVPVPESGVYDGVAYTQRQTNIEYNHLAQCSIARLGPEMKLDSGARFDSAGHDVAVRTNAAPIPHNDSNPEKEAGMADSTNKDTRKLKLDAIPGVDEKFDGEYEVPAYLSLYFDKLKITLDSLKQKADKADSLEAERDAEKRRADSLQAKVDGMDQAILDAAKERASLIATAKDRVDSETAEKLDSMSDREIKEAVIKADGSDIDLSGKSAEYVDAAYDLATKSKATANDSTRRAAADPATPGTTTVSLDSGLAANREKHNPFKKG